MGPVVDRRLVMRFEDGQNTFRHINPAASYAQLLRLARAINRFQDEPVHQIQLVTVQEF